MSDEEKYVTTLQDGKLAVRTVAQTGEIIDDRPGDKYWTALVQTADGPQECVKTVSLGGGGGGGGGTTDYTDLENKPSINSVTLTGNKTGADLGLLSNTATGTGSLSILGSVANLSNSINIGVQSSTRDALQSIQIGEGFGSYYSLGIGHQSSAGQVSVCLGAYSKTSNAQGAIAIGAGPSGSKNTKASAKQAIAIGSVAYDNNVSVAATAQQAIQLGLGTNSNAKTLQVYSYQLLDGNTGKIPTDRVAKIIELTTTSVELASDNVYNGGELASVTLTLPATVPTNFCCQVQFSSGATATTFSASGIFFEGDECAGGTFTPSANHRYSIMIYNDGVNTIGFVYEK